jgi:lipopolysaccharide export system ATP-binding protein
MTVVSLADCVAKSFGERRVLSSASLRGVAGQLRVLFGRNGEGKSTLLKIAAGVLAADSGSVQFAGRAYESPRLATLARAGLFFLPDHDFFSDAFTVRTQLEMLRQQFDGDGILDAAKRMGIAGRLDQRPHQLSGGERRRAEIAALFVRRPLAVLADEPYRGIAPRDGEYLTTAFRDLTAVGVAVVVTGHEAPTLLAAADHVTWCTDRTTYELGPPAEAIRHEEFRRRYLGAQAYLPAL